MISMIYNFEELSFQILTVDRCTHKKGSFQVKARPYAAFSYRVNGNGQFEIGGKRIVSSAGDILFLPANMPYRVDYSGGDSIFVHLMQCNYTEAENLRPENKTPIEAMFQNLLEAWRTQRSVNHAKATVYDILDKIANAQKKSIGDSAFTSCLRYMEEHFCDPTLNIQSVCAKGFLSASSLQRAYERHFGISPKQYLTRLRMNRALELLSENELSVKEIAFSCGFTDEKYFSRAFKEKYGCPPSQMQSNIHS
ncbi:MAG: AraC family transcriptional regulator [Clostridia bacterium]|nr:AraC family transcriptional regulator [Clostridia bacterium]